VSLFERAPESAFRRFVQFRNSSCVTQSSRQKREMRPHIAVILSPTNACLQGCNNVTPPSPGTMAFLPQLFPLSQSEAPHTSSRFPEFPGFGRASSPYPLRHASLSVLFLSFPFGDPSNPFFFAAVLFLFNALSAVLFLIDDFESYPPAHYLFPPLCIFPRAGTPLLQLSLLL